VLSSALGFSVSGKKVAILQSKGGGHGEIGYALAKALMDKNEVTILQDPACKRTTQPFCQYDSDLVAKGVKISDCDLSDAGAVCGALPGKYRLYECVDEDDVVVARDFSHLTSLPSVTLSFHL
jgi:UDP-N-acetylglucosamine:LPS N-acetylglucosamine transferase